MSCSHAGRDKENAVACQITECSPRSSCYPPWTNQTPHGARRPPGSGHSSLFVRAVFDDVRWQRRSVESGCSYLGSLTLVRAQQTHQDKRSGVMKWKFPQKSGMFLAFCPGLIQREGRGQEACLWSARAAVWVLLLWQKDWRSVKLLLNRQTRRNAKSFTSTEGGNLWTHPWQTPLWLQTVSDPRCVQLWQQLPACSSITCLHAWKQTSGCAQKHRLVNICPTEPHEEPRTWFFSSVWPLTPATPEN